MTHQVTICPTVTAEPNEFDEQLQNAAQLSTRIHIDVTDGHFTPSKITRLDQITMPPKKQVDLHVMYQRPGTQLRRILALQPSLVIIHAEADGVFIPYAHILHKFNIAIGVALLPQTKVHEISPVLKFIDHVLIFSGKLGFHGGKANLALLDKVRQLKAHKPNLEVGWDGGINANNAQQIIEAGASVLNVGGYIADSKNPSKAYATLKALAESHG